MSIEKPAERIDPSLALLGVQAILATHPRAASF